MIPSGGSEESDLYSLKRRFAAGFDMAVFLRLRVVECDYGGVADLDMVGRVLVARV